MTTTIDDTATHAEDAYEPEEDTNLDVALRRRMALRPIHFRQDGPHPDRRQCPAWCGEGPGSEYEHYIDARHPLSATHTMDLAAAVLATLYQGESPLGADGDRFVRAATLELHLEQRGQESPFIRVDLRRWKRRRQHYSERLRLTVADARELVKVLTYLVETADTGA